MGYDKELLDELKQKAGTAPYQQFVRGLKGIGSGKYKGHCPLDGHKDNNPSFEVYEKGGEYKWICRSHTGLVNRGDAVEFMRRARNLKFPEAVQKLAQMVGFELPEQEKAAPLEYDAAAAQNRLPEVLDYLKSRGVTEAVAKRYDIGASDVPGLGLSVAMPYNGSGDLKFRALNPPSDNVEAT